MPITPYNNFIPTVDPTAFIAPDAWLTGKVTVAAGVSIFFGSVLRGDIEEIQIGRGSNLQEHCICHTSHGMGACIVGENVTVGHRVTLHGSRIEGNCIIGMGSTLLDECCVEENCIIGAHSLVTKGMIIPAGHLALGSPAKVIRALTPQEIESIAQSAAEYRTVGASYRELGLK